MKALALSLMNCSRWFQTSGINRENANEFHLWLREIGADERTANAASVWFEFMCEDRESVREVVELKKSR